jgi:excisionase family DNA binding protein
MSTHSPTAIAAPLLVSIQEAAHLLSVSKHTLRKLISDEAVPTVRIGVRQLLSMEFLQSVVHTGLPSCKKPEPRKARKSARVA